MKLLAQTIKLGKMLVQQGHLGDEQLQKALARQKTSGKKLGEFLVDEKLVDESAVLDVLSQQLGLPSVKLRPGLVDPLVVDHIDKDLAQRHLIVPMFKVEDTLTVAMAEPQALLVVDDLERTTGLRVRPVIALGSNVSEYINKYYAQDVKIDNFVASLEDANVEVVEREAIDEGDVIDLSQMTDGSPVVNLVNLSIMQAVKEGASDIHIEPDKSCVRIRYRIDGVLNDLMTPPKEWHAAIVSRVKVIGRMDIAEKRVPQEGRIHIMVEGREIDLRISSMPTILGEKIVARVLDKNNLQLNLDRLGYSTIEDPVEYQLELVNQIQVHEAVNLTFARTLRSVLRQDPDIIMVGEIRDEETAKVAVQAALTGHLVLSTLHTNDSCGAITRLLNMNVEPYLLASCLVGVVAQRLIRTICPKCKTTYFPQESVLDDIGWQGPRNRAFHRGEGCALGRDSGFKGRRAICEVLEMTPSLRVLIMERHSTDEIKQYLMKGHWRSLKQEGISCVEQGITNIEEMMRVCFIEEEEEIIKVTDNELVTENSV
jgi:type IV pilus assembly protein PilB